MKYIITLLLFFCSDHAAYAQDIRFSKTYKDRTDNWRRIDMMTDKIALLNNRIYIPSFSTSVYQSVNYKTNWFKLGLDGSELLCVGDSISNSILAFSGLTSAGDSFLYGGGHVKNSTDTFQHWVIQKMDTNFNIIWRKTYPSLFTVATISDILSINTNSIILQGDFSRTAIGSYAACPPNVRLIKIDTSGNVIWNKQVDSASINYGKNLIRAHDGNLMVCGRTWGYGVTDGGAFVMKIDTAGNELWHHVYDLPGYDGFEKIIATGDGNYVCAGWGGLPPEISDMPNGVARIVKIDSVGNVIWDRIINVSPRSEEFRTIVEANNRDLVAFGDTYLNYAYDFYNYEVGNTGGPDGLAVRLDKDGNEKWRRVFGNNDIADCHDYIYNAVALADGSFITTGTTQIRDTGLFYNDEIMPYNRQVGWVTRMDSNGCVFQACVDSLLSVPGVASLFDRVSVYPNPAMEYVELSSARAFPKGTKVRLIGVTGSSVIATRDIGGTYRYRLELPQVAARVYILVFETEGERYYKKIVVSR